MGAFTRTVGYAYPWDLNGDASAADDAAAIGLTDLAIAAVYHGVRAATPRHPHHRLVSAAAASYVTVDPADWAGSTIAPDDAAPWAGRDSFGRAKRAAEAAGLQVRAWIVLSHSSVIGARHPNTIVKNAFGDSYEHALCPANAEVADYAARLAGATVRGAGVDDVVFEAVGQLGVDHQSAHEKTAGADWTATERMLLSLCFCASTRRLIVASGLDPDELAARVRSAIDAGGSSAEEFVASSSFAELIRLRTEAADAVHAAVVSAAHDAGATRTALHATPDPFATGPASTITPANADLGSGAIVPVWDLGAAAIARITTARQLLPQATIGAYTTILSDTPLRVDRITEEWRGLARAGATELHIHHVGLASSARLDTTRTALSTLLKETA